MKKTEKTSYINIDERKPSCTGYYLVIASIASEFGGYFDVVAAHYNAKNNEWYFSFGYTAFVLYWKSFQTIPKTIRKQLQKEYK